jgi:hypothetical protein
MRDIQAGLHEGLRDGGHYWPNADEGAADTKRGRHYCGTASSGADGHWYVYLSNGTTVCVDVDEDNEVLDLPIAGWTFTGENVTSGTDPGHVHTKSLAISLPGVAGYVDGVMWRNMSGETRTITRCQLIAGTPPSGGVVDVDVRKFVSANFGTDTNDPWLDGNTSSMPGTGTDPNVADGKYIGADVISDWDLKTLAAGDAIVFKMGTVTSPADDLVLLIEME